MGEQQLDGQQEVEFELASTWDWEDRSYLAQQPVVVADGSPPVVFLVLEGVQR